MYVYIPENKGCITYKGINIQLFSESFQQIYFQNQARRKWRDIFKLLKIKCVKLYS